MDLSVKQNIMTTLIVTNRILTSLADGYDLRVWYLSKSLAKCENLVLLSISLPEKVYFNNNPIDLEEGVFKDILTLKYDGIEKASICRHMRLQQADYLQFAYPRFFKKSVRLVNDALTVYDTNKMVVFGSDLCGIIRTFRDCKVLYDVCDSRVLTIEREFDSCANKMTGIQKIRTCADLWRWKRTEGCLPHCFRHVTTINKADSDAIMRLSGGMQNISTVPNGVHPSLESLIIDNVKFKKKGIVFWGNLDFRPNRSALRYFYENVYRPYLAKTGLEWCIVGRNPDPWLLDEATSCQSIRLTGYVEDLYSLIREYPIMVNPMISGSGMKNKVLEAFALNIAVVSTPLGMESIDGAIPGTHYLEAEDPEEFGKSIQSLLDDELKRSAIAENAKKLLLENFTWNKTGEQWIRIFQSCLNN